MNIVVSIKNCEKNNINGLNKKRIMINFTHTNDDNNDNYENDDLITFQYELKTIQLFYSQLVKYSKHSREKILYTDCTKRIPTEIDNIQKKFQINTDSFILFFHLLEQNFNLQTNDKLTYKECVDLLKISTEFEARKLTNNIKKYIETHNNEVSFILEMIQYEYDTTKNSLECEEIISQEIEDILIEKIDECLTNDQFKEIPIFIIYRIVKKSSKTMTNFDKLYNFIKSSLDKFCVLFSFIELDKLSENRIDDICSIYLKSDDMTKSYFNYFPCNFKYINQIRIIHQNEHKKFETEINELETKLKTTEKSRKEIEEENIKQKNEFATKIKELEEKLNASERARKTIEEEKTTLEKELNEERNSIITGEIKAKVKNGLLIYGKMNITITKSTLDTSKSKYIISSSCDRNIDLKVYEKGESITALKQRTIYFGCKAGTYYIRCLIFDMNGKSTEIISNEVTTNGSFIPFEYEGKPSEVLLSEGRYKLEVWGAQGGDSIGTRKNSIFPGKGGLGGYSTGILNLSNQERLHIYVGESGHPSNLIEGSTTSGSFPDGGGTKTGHYSNYTSSPGTGGGSTSIRISTDSLYTRVIVAGGGGGASGCTDSTDNGGFGGGTKGGNCYYKGTLQEQGSGTQTGSTRGLDNLVNGDPGKFGQGATGKYRHEDNSGGGGGGGWYGGGSGGCGCTKWCSSGGGGSGWIFTENDFNAWKSGDTKESYKFMLTNKYYLTNASTRSGNEEFPTPDGDGTEVGHIGNGYAKITLL